MKNVFLYHLIANVPLVIWIVVYYLGLISSPTFIIVGSAYALIYLPVVDYYRLKALKIAQKGDLWEMWDVFRLRRCFLVPVALQGFETLGGLFS